MFASTCLPEFLFSTRQITLGILLIFMCSTSITLAVDNITFENVSVLKQDGWTHKFVSVVLDPSGKFISMERLDGSVRDLPVSEIFQILDSQGKDISTEVIPGFKPVPNSSFSRPGKKSRSTYDEFGVEGAPEVKEGTWYYQENEPPRMFDVMVVGGLGYSTQVGSFYSGLQSGLSYNGEIAFSVSPRKYIKLGFRTTRAAENTTSYYSYELDGMTEVHSTLDVRQYNLSVGTLSRPNDQNSIRYYTEIGLGIADHVFKSDAEYYYSQEESLTRLMILFNGGVLFPINDHLGVDLGVSSGIKMFSTNDNEGIGFLFDFRAGLTLRFGGE